MDAVLLLSMGVIAALYLIKSAAQKALTGSTGRIDLLGVISEGMRDADRDRDQRTIDIG
jgi:hypothetical protein